MGSSQRLAAVAAISHARHYNHTQTSTVQTEPNPYTVNIFFVSATLCGVLVAVCAACWRRSPREYKPEDAEIRGVYTVSADCRLNQIQMELPGPPPAYETVVDDHQEHKACHMLEEVVSEPCSHCPSDELPSYEAAVMLKDTKL